MDVLTSLESMEDRLRRIVVLHFDPLEGSVFWLTRAAERGLDPRRIIRSPADLALLGEVTPQDLSERSVWDYVPRCLHARLDRMILGQAWGPAGREIWTAYREDEFEEAFVLPFVAAATHVGFPAEAAWLYVGPGGPHAVAKSVRPLATSLGGPDAFSVDFDPRWERRFPEGSFGRRRYTHHVVDQAMDIIRTQRVEVLFTSPVILERLASTMSREQRQRIRGVYYSGQPVTASALRHLQEEAFPEAVHLAGYTHALFGSCMEVHGAPGRPMRYYPHGNRLIVEVVDAAGKPLPPGREGHVRLSRLDETMLIVGYTEPGRARGVPLPAGAPEGFSAQGLEDPEPVEEASQAETIAAL